MGGNDTYVNKLVKIFEAKTKCYNIKRKKVMKIKRQNFKTCKMLSGGNDNMQK